MHNWLCFCLQHKHCRLFIIIMNNSFDMYILQSYVQRNWFLLLLFYCMALQAVKICNNIFYLNIIMVNAKQSNPKNRNMPKLELHCLVCSSRVDLISGSLLTHFCIKWCTISCQFCNMLLIRGKTGGTQKWKNTFEDFYCL